MSTVPTADCIPCHSHEACLTHDQLVEDRDLFGPAPDMTPAQKRAAFDAYMREGRGTDCRSCGGPLYVGEVSICAECIDEQEYDALVARTCKGCGAIDENHSSRCPVAIDEAEQFDAEHADARGWE